MDKGRSFAPFVSIGHPTGSDLRGSKTVQVALDWLLWVWYDQKHDNEGERVQCLVSICCILVGLWVGLGIPGTGMRLMLGTMLGSRLIWKKGSKRTKQVGEVTCAGSLWSRG